MEINIKASHLFPVVIYRCNLPNKLEPVKEWIYQSKNQNPQGVTFSNVLGWQSDLLEPNEYNPNIGFLNDFLATFADSVLKGRDYNLTDLWLNISPQLSSNKIHRHTDYVGPRSKNKWSGVYYIQVPKNGGDICFTNPYLLDEFSPYTPTEGEVIIFPSQVYHSVEVNESTEDRISIAFNFELELNNDE